MLFSVRGAGAVLHSHSKHAVLATLITAGSEFKATHLEMIKVIPITSYYPKSAYSKRRQIYTNELAFHSRIKLWPQIAINFILLSI